MSARVGVVLAGGVGARIGLDVPKQLLRIGGRTILEHSIARFDAHPEVERVVVLMTPSHLDVAQQIAASYPKVGEVLPGDDTRNGTTLRALEVVGPDDTHVLFHDAVRPLVSDRIISDCFAALVEFEACDTAIPSADTIVEVDADEVIVTMPRRDRLRRGQTPQGFHAGTLRRAYALAAADPDFHATDDCGVVHRYLPDVAIKVVAGEERNMKVTDPVDVHLAERLLGIDDAREGLADYL